LARPRSRIEYFVFGLLAEMQGHEVQLYAILLNGALNRYPTVKVTYESDMPSGGALSNPNDKALVTDLEDKMIEAYGTALVEVKCKAAVDGKVDLGYKMLRPQHVGALFAAVERYKVAELDLSINQLGAAGGALVAAVLETNTTLTTLKCAQLGRPSNQGQGLAVSPEGPTHYLPCPFSSWLRRLRSLGRNKLGHEAGMALAEALKSNTTLTELESAALPSNPPAHALRPHSMHARCTGPLHCFPSPFAQASRKRPRPRGWHVARRGPQEQHHPHGARVCCSAIEPIRRCVTVFPSPPRFRASHALPRSLEASQHLPRPRLTRDQPFPACVSDESRTRTAHTQPAHTQSKLLACRPRHCHPRPRTPRGPRPRPSFAHGWVASARAPSRLHLLVAVCVSTASAPTPSRPSERPPATASSWSSSKPAGSGLQLHVDASSHELGARDEVRRHCETLVRRHCKSSK
jgi:hypothetical protein